MSLTSFETCLRFAAPMKILRYTLARVMGNESVLRSDRMLYMIGVDFNRNKVVIFVAVHMLCR